MRAFILGLTALTLLAPVPAQGEEPDYEESDYTVIPFGFDLLPMVGTSGATPGDKVVRNVSLNLIGGYTAGIDGLELGGVFNLNTDFMEGLQFSGGANIVGGYVHGLQGSGGVNIVGANMEGIQGAGGVNVVGANAEGFQGAGGVNIVGGEVEGVQGAGGANIVGADLEGMQAAGGANIVGGTLEGFQLSGGANIVGQDVDGAQLSTVNIAGGDVTGAQIGVVNISQNSTFSFGLVNIVTEGRTHLDLWANEAGFSYATLKHGGDYFHGLYSVGVRPFDMGEGWSLGLGYGLHLPVSDYVRVDLDAMTHQIYRDTAFWSSRLNLLNQGRLSLGVTPMKGLTLFAGPTVNVLVSDYEDWGEGYPLGDSAGQIYVGQAVTTRLWGGFSAGLQLF